MKIAEYCSSCPLDQENIIVSLIRCIRRQWIFIIACSILNRYIDGAQTSWKTDYRAQRKHQQTKNSYIVPAWSTAGLWDPYTLMTGIDFWCMLSSSMGHFKNRSHIITTPSFVSFSLSTHRGTSGWRMDVRQLEKRILLVTHGEWRVYGCKRLLQLHLE